MPLAVAVGISPGAEFGVEDRENISAARPSRHHASLECYGRRSEL